MNAEVIEREDLREKAEVDYAVRLNQAADEAAGPGGKKPARVLLCFDGRVWDIPRELANTMVRVEIRKGYTIQIGERQWIRGPETADMPLSMASRYVHMYEQKSIEKIRELLGLDPLPDYSRILGVAETVDLALARVEQERQRLVTMKAKGK
jgi:hypothetical protein